MSHRYGKTICLAEIEEKAATHSDQEHVRIFYNIIYNYFEIVMQRNIKIMSYKYLNRVSFDTSCPMSTPPILPTTIQ